jgi:hypothetical protein
VVGRQQLCLACGGKDDGQAVRSLVRRSGKQTLGTIGTRALHFGCRIRFQILPSHATSRHHISWRRRSGRRIIVESIVAPESDVSLDGPWSTLYTVFTSPHERLDYRDKAACVHACWNCRWVNRRRCGRMISETALGSHGVFTRSGAVAACFECLTLQPCAGWRSVVAKLPSSLVRAR